VRALRQSMGELDWTGHLFSPAFEENMTTI
jgi:hypothetical protein